MTQITLEQIRAEQLKLEKLIETYNSQKTRRTIYHY